MSNSDARGIISHAVMFEAEVHTLLQTYEAAHQSRVITLSDILTRLDSLSLRQENLFRQALRCAETGIFLAAHVMAWAAAIDFFEEKLASDDLVKVRTAYPNWTAATLDELRETVREFQLIEAGKRVGLLTHSQMKSLQSHLHTRNQAAHPTGFDPGINETLGYVEALLKLCGILSDKSL